MRLNDDDTVLATTGFQIHLAWTNTIYINNNIYYHVYVYLSKMVTKNK
jgi:hypothetical protein